MIRIKSSDGWCELRDRRRSGALPPPRRRGDLADCSAPRAPSACFLFFIIWFFSLGTERALRSLGTHRTGSSAPAAPRTLGAQHRQRDPCSAAVPQPRSLASSPRSVPRPASRPHRCPGPRSPDATYRRRWERSAVRRRALGPRGPAGVLGPEGRRLAARPPAPLAPQLSARPRAARPPRTADRRRPAPAPRTRRPRACARPPRAGGKGRARGRRGPAVWCGGRQGEGTKPAS